MLLPNNGCKRINVGLKKRVKSLPQSDILRYFIFELVPEKTETKRK